MSGFTLAQKSVKQLKTSSKETCAKLCSTDTEFDCLSFDYCKPADQDSDVSLPYNCLLHEVHMLDNLQNSIEFQTVSFKSDQALCGHFSRDFMYDFKTYH